MSGLPELAPKPAHSCGMRQESAQLRDTIFFEVKKQCISTFQDKLSAVVSTGSLARSEATSTLVGTSWTISGDAEFMLVFYKDAHLPSGAAIALLGQQIESELARLQITCKIDLSPVYPAYFQHLPAHLFTYELKHCGEVICGDQTILQSIPDYPVEEISREDAWRLLCNRLIEVLEHSEAPGTEAEVSSQSQKYRLVKLVLDMATSLLIFERAFVPSYRARRDALVRLASQGTHLQGLELDLQAFASLVFDCTACKLQPIIPGAAPLNLPSSTVLQMAHALWRWELAQLAGAPFRTDDTALLMQWFKLQSPRKNVRGWLYVMRACGWHRSYRWWPRWWALRNASPRHWTYLVAANLLFQATDATSDRHVATWKSLSRLLPVTKKTDYQHSGPSWKDIAADVLWNYRQFLTGTRA
jgi:hypothetical protein